MTTENERMATLETELKQITSILNKLDGKFDDMNNAYVPRAEIDEKFKSRDEKIVALTVDVVSIKADRQSNKALAPAWVAVMVAIAALLIPLLK